MTISEKELQALSNLAYLELDNEHSQALGVDINAIILFVQQLKTVDTKAVAPLYHAIDNQQYLRDDTITENDCTVELAQCTPHFSDLLYWVPKVIDEANES